MSEPDRSETPAVHRMTRTRAADLTPEEREARARHRQEARAKQAERQQRVHRAIQLQLGGATLDQIAAECGFYDRSAAKRAIDKHLSQEVKPATEELRARSIRRLDQLLLSVWTDALARPKLDAQGNVVEDVDWQRRNAAVELVIRIEDRRARLEGLDKPLKIDLDQHARELARYYGLPEDDLIAEMQEVRAEARRNGLRLVS